MRATRRRFAPPRQRHRRRFSRTSCGHCTALRKENERLRNENEQLRKENEAQRQENSRLRERLAKAERAGKRQAAPFSRGQPKRNPKRAGRKPGRDYGVGARRRVPNHVDEVHDVPPPNHCPYCGGVVKDTNTVSQYQEDIPPVKPIVRRFDIHIGRCVRCKRSVRGRHPLQTTTAVGAAGVHVGPHALALAADLNKRIGVSFGKLNAVFHTAFSLSVTRGGFCLALHRVASVLTPTYDALVRQVRHAPLVASDETGWKVGGHLHWLWVFVTNRVTVYRIMAGRGYEEACTVLGADFRGTLLRDGWSPYRRFEYATHQTCLAHLVRRCVENLETAQRGTARLPHAVLRILRRALQLRDHWLDHSPTVHGRAVHTGRLIASMDRLLAWNPIDEENRKLLKHLGNECTALFTFLDDPSVPATNWWGEQAIRPAVVTRKIWGGNRTASGAVTQQTIASVLRTCHQQGVDPCPMLEDLLRSPVATLVPLPSLASGP
jgi:transposase